MKTKSLFKSKTVWFNTIMGVLAFLTLIKPDLLIVFGLDTVSQQKALTVISTITAFLNLVLRMMTNSAVAISPANDTMPVG